MSIDRIGDIFGRSQMPSDLLDRRERVRLLMLAADLLIDSGTEEGMFAGGALRGWLTEGGSLERDFLKVTGERGSQRTPSAIAHELKWLDGLRNDEE